MAPGRPQSEIKLWDVATGSKVAEITVPEFVLRDVYLSPDGATLLATAQVLFVGQRGLSPGMVWDIVPSSRDR
jgi:hypothetical protein